MTGVAAREERFRGEALRWDLRWRCPHCVHQAPGAAECSMGYPNDMLLTPDLYCLNGRGGWIFCKFFELDGP